jgi:hypothetical protein
MARSSLAELEETKNAVMGELDVVFKIGTPLRFPPDTYTATDRSPLLSHIRQLLRIDLSAIDLSTSEGSPADKQLSLAFLKTVLTYHREIATKLDHLLQIRDPLQRKRIRKIIGSPSEIEAVLEALEDKIEDLEIATNPEVHAAIEQLIDEAKAPEP